MGHADDAERLRQQGHRMTPQRLMVLDVIKRSGKHLTADEIHAAVLEQHPYVNIATIYRTLQWLQDVALVAPMSFGSEPLRYEYVRGKGHHHLICLECGVEQQIDDDILDSVKAHLLERYDFTAHLNHIALPGHCAVCREALNGNALPAQEHDE